MSCSTFGISCNLALDPMREVDAKSRMKSGCSETDMDALAFDEDSGPDMGVKEGGGTSTVSCAIKARSAM